MPHAANRTQRFARMHPLVAVIGTVTGIFLCTALIGDAHARSSDRNQPMNIASNQQSGSLDENAVNTWSGNVVITQGTLDIRAGKADVYQSGGEPVKAIMTGGPVVLKQQMDDGSPMTAKADRIEYDMTTDVIVLIGNYTVTTPRGSTNGQRLTYDLKSGRIESGGQTGGRVTMTIQPKSKQGAKPSTSPSTNPAPTPTPPQKPN
jgi:lipopolysaccharide export system protein LptA